MRLRTGAPLRSTVLKAPHHTPCAQRANGSQTSLSAKFLEAVGPQLAVISCGADNEFGHPHPQGAAPAGTLDKLEEAGCTALRTLRVRSVRTDQAGTVEVVTDRKGLWVHAQRPVDTQCPVDVER